MSPGSIAFNDTVNLHKTHTLTITNYGDSIVGYNILKKVSVSVIPYNVVETGYDFTEPAQLGTDIADLRISQNSLKLSPGASADITITVIPPNTDPKLHIMYGGYVEFKNTVPNRKSITVPYIGIVGDQRELPIFKKSMPILLDGSGIIHWDANDPVVFVRRNQLTRPSIRYVMVTPSKLVTFPLFGDNGQQLGFAFHSHPFNIRTMNYEPAPELQWDGTYFVPDPEGISKPITSIALPGKYRIGVRALKLLGDENKKDDWDIWVSGTIEVV